MAKVNSMWNFNWMADVLEYRVLSQAWRPVQLIREYLEVYECSLSLVIETEDLIQGQRFYQFEVKSLTNEPLITRLLRFHWNNPEIVITINGGDRHLAEITLWESLLHGGQKETTQDPG